MNKIKSIISICLLLFSISTTAYATKTITLVVGFPPGTGNDLVARQVAKDITEAGELTVIVENKVGAGGNIALKEVIGSNNPKLFLHSNSLYLNAIVTRAMLVDLNTQLVPVSFIGYVPMILVTGASSSLQKFEDISKSKTENLTYGSGGIASLTHANMAYISYLLNTPMTHIPYQGAAKAAIDLAAGRVDLYFDFYNSAIPFIKDNRVRPLAVAGSTRLKELPDVPTLKDKGIEWPLEAFYILFANNQVDKETLNTIEKIISKTLRTNSTPYENQGIQIDKSKLSDVNKFHADMIQQYKKLNFPFDIKNEKP
jgi:tripartite-type tricarboxylate transporter receptor subunit TctC